MDASVEKKRIKTKDTEASAQRAQRRRKRVNTEDESAENTEDTEEEGRPDSLGTRFDLERLASGGDWGVDGREPAVAVGLGAAREREEFFLEFARDGAGDAFADL